MYRVLLAAASAAVLVGCASNMGTQTVNDFNRFMDLEAGESTVADIYERFGQPHAVSVIEPTNERMWTYASIRERMNATTVIPFVGLVTGGSDVDATVATFYFDANDQYLRSERNERSRYKNMWLGMADAFTRSGEVERVCAEMDRLNIECDRQAATENASAIDQFLE